MIANNRVAPLHPNEFYFYFKPQLNLVAYDATIQGSLFTSHDYFTTGEVTRDIEPVIFSQQFGAVYSTNRWVYEASAIFQTKDTRVMIHDWHQWGTIEVLYRFN